MHNRLHLPTAAAVAATAPATAAATAVAAPAQQEEGEAAAAWTRPAHTPCSVSYIVMEGDWWTSW